jgi:uncharacterized protein (TIGR02145 family)
MSRHISVSICLILILQVVASVQSNAQLIIVPGSNISLTPLQFVQTYLVGPGVTVSNATYNGSANPLNVVRPPSFSMDQIGTFTASGSANQTLGLGGGIMLSSGKVQNASHDVFPNGNANSTTNSGSDPDLTLLAGVNSRDKSILEFDFVPGTDIISFRYVFASEEFDEWCDQFNDAFGFFISGPGIPPGPYSGGAQNIAFLPQTILNVTINNICSSDSGIVHGTYSWWNGNGPIYNYDRFTNVYTASIGVTCSQTYHLKIAIGDASDAAWDSGIFLEENSLTSNNFTSSANFSNPLTGQFLVEGCSNVTLVYEIPQLRSTDMTIDLAIGASGTATQADILPNPFPLSVVIPAGMLQSSPISIQPVSDGLPEPIENLIINASTTVCTITNSATTEFSINNYDPLSAQVDDVTVCNGSSATLIAKITGGQTVLPAGTFNYAWSTGETTSTITVLAPPGHNLYAVTVTDACGQSAFTQASVDVGTIPGPAGTIAGITDICTPAAGVAYSIPLIPGADSYVWTLPPGASVTSGNNTNSITVDFNTAASSGNISVMGHNNNCGDGLPSALALTINPAPAPAGPITGSNMVCQGDPAKTYSLDPLSFTTGYEWSLPAGVTIVSGAGTNQVTCLFTTSAVSGNITVRGHNAACGYGTPSSLYVTVNPLPGAAGMISGTTTICTPANGLNYSIPVITGAGGYIWTLPAGATITAGNNTNSITVDFSTSAGSGSIGVRGHSNFCGDGPSSTLPVTINPSPEPAGIISGPSPVCQGSSPTVYSLDPLDFTTDYEWSVPSGVTIISGGGTNLISCVFTTSAISGNFSVSGHNTACGSGTPYTLPVTVNPIPGAAGMVSSTNGSEVCQGQTGVIYTIPSIANTLDYLWTYTGPGATLTNNGSSLLIDFSTTASAGILTVMGHNACGTGIQSPSFPISVNTKPTVSYSACNTVKTTKNGRPILLKGGTPTGSGGAFSGTGVTMVSPGVFVFDPANGSVSGGSPVAGIGYPITYRYTNSFGCSDAKASVISVYASNASDPCPGILTDHRDGRVYPTFMTGTVPNARCWMASNLDYGSYTDQSTVQKDDCVSEKYCENNLSGQCAIYGGLYQWGEIMEYSDNSTFQDLCPAGWHIATSGEWDQLISNSMGDGIAGRVLKDLYNPSGFQGILGGIYYMNSSWSFTSGPVMGMMYWTSGELPEGRAIARGLNSMNPSVSLYPSSRANALSVRCVRN